MLLIKHYQEIIYGESNEKVTFDLERPSKVTDFEAFNLIKESKVLCYY